MHYLAGVALSMSCKIVLLAVLTSQIAIGVERSCLWDKTLHKTSLLLKMVICL